MNYATIKYCDIANGEGVRTSLFVSGCRRHCPNCFNAVAWDFGYGAPFTKEVRNEILESLAPGYINGLSLLAARPSCRLLEYALTRPPVPRSIPPKYLVTTAATL